MKKAALIGLMLVLSSTSAMAKGEFKIGTEASSITYKEPGLMQEKGTMFGVAGSYTYRNGIMLRGEGRAAWGSVDYSSPVSGTLNDIEDSLNEERGIIGYQTPLKPLGFTLTPYTGIGRRYLQDDGSGKVTSVGHFSYKRESTYFYAPLGLEFRKTVASGWTVEVEGELDIFISGQQKNHTGAIPGYMDFTNKQDTGIGQRVSINLVKDTGAFLISVGPFIRHWDVRDSDLTQGFSDNFANNPLFYEPRNNSTEVGLNVSVRF